VNDNDVILVVVFGNIINVRRGSSRSRDSERSRFLNGNDHSTACAGEKQKKIYEFAGTEALCCGYPIAITTEYSIAATVAAAAAAPAAACG
jgi:hypothetical protein